MLSSWALDYLEAVVNKKKKKKKEKKQGTILCQWLSIRWLWSQHIVWLLLRWITAVTWTGEQTRHPAAAMICIYLSWIDNHEQVGKRERERQRGGGGGKKHGESACRRRWDQQAHDSKMWSFKLWESATAASKPSSQPSSQRAAWVKLNAATQSQFWPTICCMKGFFFIFYSILFYFILF